MLNKQKLTYVQIFCHVCLANTYVLTVQLEPTGIHENIIPSTGTIPCLFASINIGST